MANTWTGNNYSIDTAEDKTITCKLDRMIWYPAAADNDLVVKDSLGNILWVTRAITGAPNYESSGAEYINDLDKWVNGINVETIDGGVLKIYVK